MVINGSMHKMQTLIVSINESIGGAHYAPQAPLQSRRKEFHTRNDKKMPLQK